ncbi:unnamed protein product [Prorocentrum cordatum]|uniref:Reverse transcriptase domain-containing protein n=1 Tax=Prorocentrum cordatum TaxID=2364126 RepID=A0ABN9TVY2_9DINO|nr:unnamed protein product [Polarella glacialis]
MAIAAPGPGVYTILTPDDDDYDEDAAVAADIIEAERLPQGTQGGVPPLVGGAAVPAPVYRFRALPLPARLVGARAAGAARLGFALPAEPFALNTVGRPLSVGPGTPVQAGGLDEGGFFVVRYNIPGPVLWHERVVVFKPGPPPVGAPRPSSRRSQRSHLLGPWRVAPPRALPPLAPLEGLQEPERRPEQLWRPHPSWRPLEEASRWRLALRLVAVAMLGPPSSTCACRSSRSTQGVRYREFRAAVTTSTVTPFADWPVRGPRTLLWVSKFIVANGGSPVARHNRWKAEARLSGSEPGVEKHLRVCMALETVEGHKVGPGTVLEPVLTILPMGWSWAMRIAQSALLNALGDAGIDGSDLVVDGNPASPIDDVKGVRVAGYVDNFVVFGRSPDTVDSTVPRIRSTLEANGLVVHELESASKDASFLGLELNSGQRLSIRRRGGLADSDRGPVYPEGVARRFDEVPEELMDPDSWARIATCQVSVGTDILALEGEALILAMRRALRSESALGRRLLFIVDNLPLAMGAAKGRARSKFLKPCLTKLACLSLVTGSRYKHQPLWMPRARPEPGRLQAASRSGSRSTFLKAFRASAASAAVRGRPPLGGLSSLERLAIRPSSETLYRSLVKGFQDHCLGLALDWHERPTLDGLLVDFFNGLHLEGLGPDVGSGTLAALAHFLPGLGRSGATLLPRASRAVLGWRRRAPPFTRLPMPRAAMGAIVGYLIHRGLLRAALLTAVAHVCYLRPQEMMQVRARHLIAPAVMAGPAYQYRSILLRDSALLQAGKTGVYDDAVVIDMDAWLCPALACARATLKPDDLIMDLSFVEYRRVFIEGAVLMGLGPLEPHPCQLRRGGASEDLTLGRRSAEQVRLRGRWATFVSVKRYAKDARLLDTLSSVAPEVFIYGNLVLNSLSELLRNGSGLPAGAPPLAAAALTHGLPEVVQYLKGALASELRQAARLRRFAFLELFAGSGQLGRALRAAGHACVSLDINNGPLENHLSPAFWSTVRGWLQGRVLVGVWLGTPCATWSRALRKLLRTIQAPMGLADLNKSELARLQVGNDTFELSVHVIRARV